MNIVVGQRFVSHTEANLGLGIVIESTGRLMTISFPAANETRSYAKESAPISRIIYARGDTVTDMDEHEYCIQKINTINGLIVYECLNQENQLKPLSELQLNCFVHFTSPRQRLLSGQFGGNSAFKLRFETLNHLHRLQKSSICGLQGARVELLAHQLYIANEVARRHAPRILLADEVGLGKTIEAGLIIHQQIHTGRAQRVLILVPESLIHQWLVEMLRRFNLTFSIFDKSRIESIKSMVYEFDEEDEDYEQLRKDFPEHSNPFDSEQQILCSLALLSQNPEIQKQVVKADWDLIIVDEAHHLAWSEQNVSIEYQCIEQLAAKNSGLLLLTATPEQAGIEGHFARLKLLDPDRFYDLSAFKQEQTQYQQTNLLVIDLLNLIEQLNSSINDQTLQKQLAKKIQAQLPEKSNQKIDIDYSNVLSLNHLLEQLIDQRGTGRVLFRNTRTAIKGFPERQLKHYPLACPDIYADTESKSESDAHDIHQQLHPEHQHPESEWLDQDPRVEWLVEKLKTLKPEKVLVICHHAATAKALDMHLNLKRGIRSTAFYPGLTIIERDRAAAYFADDDSGAQVLICSEIGSEGRNFQFSHHLVLFDLPLNPDLIEQRIGRLDRIGQHQTIEIHVPYLLGTPQHLLFQWYHQGLNLFQQSCSAGYAIYQKFSQPLLNSLLQGETDCSKLINSTADYAKKLKLEMEQGRDHLLELNSCRPEIAKKIIKQIISEENNTELAEYMQEVFDEMGVEQEYHSENTLIIKPGERMHSDYFPGLKPEGNTITFDRQKALSREDIEFISWEHPMVVEIMEIIEQEEMGKAAVATISVKGLPPATILLECQFSVKTLAPKNLQLERYLPISPTRILLTLDGKDLSHAVPHESLNKLCKKLPKRIARTVVDKLKDSIEKLLERATKMTSPQLKQLKNQAQKVMMEDLGRELERMEYLQTVNPLIRDEEINYLKKLIKESSSCIENAEMVVQGVRLIINQN